jgi:SAM-dependent methyltransferase
MEHVQDDGAAFREIARMLKPDGFAIIVVPLRGEKTFEDPSVRPEDFQRYFGQFDHVRFYGKDIVERFRRAGLRVEIIDVLEYFTHDQLRRYVLCGNDRYFYKVMRK